MINIGIDASTTCIGWSIFNDDDILSWGKIKPNNDDLDWRDRIQDLSLQLQNIISKYNIENAYIEDVPLFEKKGKLTLVQLGAVQGNIIGVMGANNIKTNFIPVSTWRKNIGLWDGTKEGKKRDILKEHSVQKANELFGLDLKYISKCSKYNDDDISDSILVYCSTRKKYQVKNMKFGKTR